MTLIKTALLNGIAVVIKMLTLLGLNKILALYVGPAGYATLGQFQNLIQIITTFFSGAINTGVTKYTAEYHEDEKKQHQLWSTAALIAVMGSFIAIIVISIFKKKLAIFFLKDPYLSNVLLWFAAVLVFFIFNALLLAILNGKKEIVPYIKANIAGSILALIMTTVISMRFGLYGALIALATYQSFSFIITFIICYKLPWFKINYFLSGLNKPMLLNLLKYTLMALTSAACVPISYMLIRNHLGETFSWTVAGYWEAMWRLSSAYLLLVTTTLNVYYLPRFSELKETKAIKAEILQGYKIILPIAAVCASLTYLLRNTIIELLFTSDFLPMHSLFFWQMLGDTLKIGSWLLAYLMLSKGMARLFIVTEISFCLTFYLLVILFTQCIGFVGVSIAYAINYLCYWIFLFFFWYRKQFIF